MSPKYPEPDDPCGEVCLALSELALGRDLDPAETRALAGHVRGCPSCEAFVDELASVRGWLEAVRPPSERSAGRGDLTTRARRALLREVAARLARDLLALSRGRPMREAEERRRDLALLDVLRRSLRGQGSGGSPLAHADACRVSAVLGGAESVDRREALRLAVLLDPLGLDVSLAWMGVLSRAGDHSRAEAVADRFLEEL